MQFLNWNFLSIAHPMDMGSPCKNQTKTKEEKHYPSIINQYNIFVNLTHYD